jgi:transcription elongation GreA/GreB family factor
MKSLSLVICQKLLLHSTAKFLTQELGAIQEKLKDEDISYESKEVLRKKTIIIQSYLNRQLYTPPPQSEMMSLGNGIRVLINREEKTFFVDSFCYGKCKNIVSLVSPFGVAVFGKKIGEVGKYTTTNGKIIQFKILGIIPYLEAKRLLKIKTPGKRLVNLAA